MKKVVLFLVSVFITFSAFAQIKSVPEFRAKKIEFYCQDDFNKVVKDIDNELAFIEQHKSEYSEELYLTLKNCLIVDKLYFTVGDDDELSKSEKETFKDLMLNQEKVCDDYLDSKSESQISGDFLASLGDLKCQMPFVMSVTRAMPKMAKAKDLYDTAVENNPSCANLISQSLWYFFAPGISGGSTKKALDMLVRAEKAATTEGDKYFALMFKGQVLVKLKRNDEAMTAFRTAHNMFPKETFSKYMERQLDIELNY